MLRNFLLIALRNLWRNKALSAINISGLALGMAGATPLLLNIQYVVSKDQFHEKKDHLYRAYANIVVNGHLETWGTSSSLLAPALQQSYPEIKDITRISGTGNLFSHGDKKIQSSGNYVDPAFLSMFSFPLAKGDPQSALNDVYSIVISEPLAKKLFGEDDPINKIIRLDNATDVTVTGVLKDLPDNSSFHFEYLLPWSYQVATKHNHDKWDYYYVDTYVELEPGTNLAQLNAKISDIVARNSQKQEKAKVLLYPFSKVNLYGEFVNGKPAGGNISDVRFLSILALIILSIACINFMNLGTARSEKRAKEVGVRKVVGALKRSLVFQFIGESIVMAALSGVIALMLVQLLLPVFSDLSKTHLTIQYLSPWFWLAAAGFIIFTGVLAGSYPAFYLSSFKPVKVLKGVLKNGNALVTPRKILVVLQFVLSIILINFTIVFKKQIYHVQQRDPGFVKENLIYHHFTDDLRKNYTQFENELLSSGVASFVSKSNNPVTYRSGAVTGLVWQGQDPNANISFELINARQDYITTNGLTLLKGRDIDVANYPTDTAACLINEAAAKVMNFSNPVGQIVKNDGRDWRIVGVMKDFIYGGPHQSVNPLIVFAYDPWGVVNIRLNPNNTFAGNRQKAEAILKKYNPNFVSEYHFADDEYERKFDQPKKISSLINSFAGIAIFISCMGLFGLTIYMAENKTREIGIRKVLGASVAKVTLLLARNFVKLVLIAIIIASPIAWLLMGLFLQNFEYRTSLSIWIPVATGAVALLIAMATISFHSIKAAMLNPVKSLRTE